MGINVCCVVQPVRGRRQNRHRVLTELIEPAAAMQGYVCEEIPPMGAPGVEIGDIISALIRADLLVVDVTDHSDPTVFYLLGIHHVLSNRTILIAEGPSNVLSDFMKYNVIIYLDEDGERVSLEEFRNKFRNILDRIHESPRLPGNPVQEHLPDELRAVNRQRIIDENKELRQRIEEQGEPPPRDRIRFKPVKDSDK